MNSEVTSKEGMVGHPNEDLIRTAYDAFGRGDTDTVGELFADDIAFHVSGKSPSPAMTSARRKCSRSSAAGGVDRELVPYGDRRDPGERRVRRCASAMDGAARGEGPPRRRHVSVFRIKDKKIADVWRHAGDVYAQDELFS